MISAARNSRVRLACVISTRMPSSTSRSTAKVAERRETPSPVAARLIVTAGIMNSMSTSLGNRLDSPRGDGPAAIAGLECLQRPYPVQRVGGLLGDAGQEEGEPPRPVTVRRDPKQVLVIGISAGFDPGGDVQQRRRQQPPFDQQEDNQEPTDPAVAVYERMYRLELVVEATNSDQRRVGVIGMKILLERIQALPQTLRWRRNIGRVVQGAAGRPDPVGAAPKLSRRRVASTHPGQQRIVCFRSNSSSGGSGGGMNAR